MTFKVILGFWVTFYGWILLFGGSQHVLSLGSSSNLAPKEKPNDTNSPPKTDHNVGPELCTLSFGLK